MKPKANLPPRDKHDRMFWRQGTKPQDTLNAECICIMNMPKVVHAVRKAENYGYGRQVIGIRFTDAGDGVEIYMRKEKEE